MPTESARSVRWLPTREAGGGEPPSGWRTFEFTSRGDRVLARFHAPPGTGRHALALVAIGDAAEVPAAEGVATLTLDLPLLGTRRSPKWTERLRTCLAEGPACATDHALVDEFLAQAVLDLAGAVDVCAGLPEIDPERLGLVGIGPGAPAVARLQATDPRVRASVLSAEGICDALAPDEEAVRQGGGALLTTQDPDPGAALRTLRAALG